MTAEESEVRRWLVDICRWRPYPAQFDAAVSLLPPHERPAIFRFVKEDDRKRALPGLTEFYRYWCLKEAFAKAIAAAIGFGHRLEFHHEDWTNISILIDGEVSKKWRFWLFRLDETHLVCMDR